MKNTAVTLVIVLQGLLQARALVTSDAADLQLLGAGSGRGSCAAPPFRSTEVHWRFGCPPFASCCTELGYCRSQVRIYFQVFGSDRSSRSGNLCLSVPSAESCLKLTIFVSLSTERK